MNCAGERSPSCFNLELDRARSPELGQLGLALRNLGKKLKFNLARMFLELIDFRGIGKNVYGLIFTLPNLLHIGT